MFFKFTGNLHLSVSAQMDVTILSKEVLSELKQIKILIFENKTVLNVEELAQYAGFSKSKIYKLLSKKLIPIGANANIRQKFFYKEDIDQWLIGVSKEELETKENSTSFFPETGSTSLQI